MRFVVLCSAVMFGASLMQPLSASAYGSIAASEEDPPAACGIGDAVYGAQCYGGNCDNTRLYCADTNFVVTHRYWTSNFSEEDKYWRFCGSQAIMTGLSCSGGNCDNVSIECSTIRDKYGYRLKKYNCDWSGSHSEEQGALIFPTGKYASGMLCTGGRCDNHRYYICNYRR